MKQVKEVLNLLTPCRIKDRGFIFSKLQLLDSLRLRYGCELANI